MCAKTTPDTHTNLHAKEGTGAEATPVCRRSPGRVHKCRQGRRGGPGGRAWGGVPQPRRLVGVLIPPFSFFRDRFGEGGCTTRWNGGACAPHGHKRPRRERERERDRTRRRGVAAGAPRHKKEGRECVLTPSSRKRERGGASASCPGGTPTHTPFLEGVSPPRRPIPFKWHTRLTKGHAAGSQGGGRGGRRAGGASPTLSLINVCWRDTARVSLAPPSRPRGRDF